jgi:elongation factor Ts
MTITASDIAKLRNITGAGMMDCKNALTEAKGDFDEAIDLLRKRGQKISAKRADKEATEGLVVALTNPENNKGIIIQLNCETDFVAKNQDFIDFANAIAQKALNAYPKDLETLLNLQLDGLSISDHINQQVAKIGEKIELSSYDMLNAACITAYIHMGNKIGVLVAMNQKGDKHIIEAGKDVAMQIAAMNPIAVDKENVPQSAIDKELEIAREQIKAEGKPDHIAEKIALGKLNKFFKENTLLNQDFVKDSGISVKQMLESIDKELTVTSFKRISIG